MKSILFPIIFIYFFSDLIVIGFEETRYIVDESVGSLKVNVTVFNPPLDQELVATTINLVVQTTSKSASKD